MILYYIGDYQAEKEMFTQVAISLPLFIKMFTLHSETCVRQYSDNLIQTIAREEKRKTSDYISKVSFGLKTKVFLVARMREQRGRLWLVTISR